MTTKSLNSYFNQLSSMYSLSILHILVSLVGILSNYFDVDSTFSLFSAIFVINIIGLIYFEPLEIMKALMEGFEYKQGMKSLRNDK